jgi:hypothetical protein
MKGGFIWKHQAKTPFSKKMESRVDLQFAMDLFIYTPKNGV